MNLGKKFLPLVAPYCAIPRDCLGDTPPIACYGVSGVSTDQLGAIPLPPFLSVSPLESMRSGGAIARRSFKGQHD